MDPLCPVIRIYLATNHLAWLHADCGDDTGAYICASPPLVVAKKLKANRKFGAIHMGVPVLPNVRVKWTPTVEYQTRAGGNVPRLARLGLAD